TLDGMVEKQKIMDLGWIVSMKNILNYVLDSVNMVARELLQTTDQTLLVKIIPKSIRLYIMNIWQKYWMNVLGFGLVMFGICLILDVPLVMKAVLLDEIIKA